MQTKLKLILAILISFTSELNFDSDIIVMKHDGTLDCKKSDDVIKIPEHFNSIQVKSLETILSECKELICKKCTMSQETKDRVMSCKIIIERQPLDAIISTSYMKINNSTPQCIISINPFYLGLLIDEEGYELLLKAQLLHEFGHIFFNDLKTIEAQKKELQDKDSETLLKLINTACIENGFEPNLIKSYIQKEKINESKEMLIALIHNLQIRHNERRADLFAATMLEKGVAMQGFKRFFKLSSDIMPGYDDAAGSLKDDHDPDKLRLELFSLHSNGKIKLNLDSGKIEDVAKNKTMSPKELKYILEKNSLDYLKGKKLILATFGCILFCTAGCFIVKTNKKKSCPWMTMCHLMKKTIK